MVLWFYHTSTTIDWRGVNSSDHWSSLKTFQWLNDPLSIIEVWLHEDHTPVGIVALDDNQEMPKMVDYRQDTRLVSWKMENYHVCLVIGIPLASHDMRKWFVSLWALMDCVMRILLLGWTPELCNWQPDTSFLAWTKTSLEPNNHNCCPLFLQDKHKCIIIGHSND